MMISFSVSSCSSSATLSEGARVELLLSTTDSGGAEKFARDLGCVSLAGGAVPRDCREVVDPPAVLRDCRDVVDPPEVRRLALLRAEVTLRLLDLCRNGTLKGGLRPEAMACDGGEVGGR